MTGDNLISPYPETVDLRYYATTFGDKQKTLKLVSQRLVRSFLDENFFRIKRKPYVLDIDASCEDYRDSSCSCFRNIDERYTDNYYINILNIDQLFSVRDSIKLTFKYLRMIFSRNDCSTDLSDKIAKNEELLHFIEEYEKFEIDNNRDEAGRATYEFLISSALKACNEFAYGLSSITLKFIGTVMYAFSSVFMSRLIISSSEINNIRKSSKQNFPIVYLLKNSSRIDWFIVLITLVFLNMKIPVVLYHEKINSRLLRWIFRKCGVVFIRPQPLDIYNADAKEKVYDEAWLIFIEELIRAKNDFIFCLNTPSEDPDDWILTTFTDSIRREATKDVLVLPTIVNREKNIEKFLPEKWTEKSFFTKLIDVFFRRKLNLGFVKVNFFKPFSLTDLIWAVDGKKRDVPQISQGEMHSITSSIITHIKYDFSRLHPVMTTELISYLLLKKFRNGIRYNDLVDETNGLVRELSYRRKRLGFTGNSESVIEHAIGILGSQLVAIENKNGETFVRPVLETSSILEMAYYAHEAMMHFMEDAILFTSISMIFPNEFKSTFKNNTELKFTFSQLMNQADRLRDVLQFEFTFEKCCKSYDANLEEALIKFCDDDLIQKVEKLMTNEEKWGHRFARHFEDSDDAYDYNPYDPFDGSRSPSPVRNVRENDDAYVLNLTSGKSVYSQMEFYRNALKPYLDAYQTSAEHLKTLSNKQLPSQYYRSTLTNKITLMLSENKLTYPESLSSNVLQNTIKLFAKWNVIEIYRVDDIELLSLSGEYNVSCVEEQYRSNAALERIVKRTTILE